LPGAAVNSPAVTTSLIVLRSCPVRRASSLMLSPSRHAFLMSSISSPLGILDTSDRQTLVP